MPQEKGDLWTGKDIAKTLESLPQMSRPVLLRRWADVDGAPLSSAHEIFYYAVWHTAIRVLNRIMRRHD